MGRRIFIAVNLPEKTRKKLQEIIDVMPRNGLKIVPAENLHITLKFLGYVDEDYIDQMKQKLKKISEEKQFEIELSGIGEFNSRVIWVGISNGADSLRDLSGEINFLLGAQEDDFRAHITLARNKDLPAQKVRELVEKMKKIPFLEKIMVESIDIMESKLLPKGPEYFVLHRIQLASV